MKKSFTISIPTGVFWKVVVPVAILTVGAGSVVGVFIVDRIVMPRVVGVNKGDVVVPDVIGLEYEQARQKLYNIGLVGRTRSQEFSDTAVPGVVVRQYIAHGEKVKKGRQIDLAVSKGPEIAVVAPVKGLAEHLARLELQKKGFSVGRTIKKYDEKVLAGYVINASPVEGTRISRAMAVDLEVSDGPKPTHAVMVNVVGESLMSARGKIEAVGLKVGTVGHQNSPALEPGTVVSQSVSPGTSVAFESSVNLVVAVAR